MAASVNATFPKRYQGPPAFAVQVRLDLIVRPLPLSGLQDIQETVALFIRVMFFISLRPDT